MNSYEARQEARRERLESAAAKALAESRARFGAADKMLKMIPPGQPILIGHHSERGHRAHLRRIDTNMRKAFEADNRAGELRARAAAVGTGGISSDDPAATAKLREQLAKRERDQAGMKAANAAIRKHRRAGSEAQIAALVELGETAAAAAGLLQPDCCGRIGYPDYSLQNNNANIRRIKQRIASLEAYAKVTGGVPAEEEHGDVRLVRNTEINRLQLIFPGKPSPEVRARRKRNGFRWSPREGAWQRQINGNAEYAVKWVLGGAA